MDQDEDTQEVLSDVHVHMTHTVITHTYSDTTNTVAVSRFYLKDKTLNEKGNNVNRLQSAHIEVDDDGDLDVTRKPSEDVVAITIEHALQTKLEDVGKQVWQGCLLLADFIIHNQSDFSNATILDLGAGVGLTSIIAGMFARKVFLTDVGAAILNMAEKNVALNQHLFPHGSSVCVRHLDWQQANPFTPTEDGHSNDTSIYQFKETDQPDLLDVTIMLAAEVIYDLDLTESFFRTILNLMSTSPKTLYISLEKRIVFTTHDLDVASPAYEHFCDCLDELVKRSDDQCAFEYSCIPCDFPQFFNYNRTKELELWKIVSRHGKTDK
ncbi:methyltransferase-like protein 22 [Gigantopelta aegis]|uniref:methyltransferase-like protein 22 n=1 Tax=Gigantopelta aegis TaxID=1735272 RepID=UPI001B88BA74|nr:methyltransferase-like protein 22 [Gigantopelta aegis]